MVRKKSSKSSTPKAVPGASPAPAARTQLLVCPKCAQPMQPVEFQGIEVDRCVGCKGLWFDLLELEDLQRLKDSERLDRGSPPVGRVQNQTRRYDCPACRSEMVQMVDREPPRVQFECCAACGGIYLDAGEFRGLKENIIADWVRSMRAGERR